jgi:hypothetical protein
LQTGLIRNDLNSAGALQGRALRDLYFCATSEQRERFENAR